MTCLPVLMSKIGTLLALLLIAGSVRAEQPAAPLRIHMIGVGEYKPVESLTEFKQHLEQLYRVEITTSFGKNGKSLPNLEGLEAADVMVIFARRTNLPEEQMSLIRKHWEKGKPIVAMRTASHAFQPADNEIFDRQVLGGNYRGSGSYTTPFKAIAAQGKADHPVLKGVGPITSRGYYGNGPLAEDTVVLQVVDSERKTPLPVSWTHTWKGGRTFYTSMGVAEDFQDENFRRLLTNAIFWTARGDPDKLKK